MDLISDALSKVTFGGLLAGRLARSALMEDKRSAPEVNGLPFHLCAAPLSPKAPGELTNEAQLSLLHICCDRIALHNGGEAALRGEC